MTLTRAFPRIYSAASLKHVALVLKCLPGESFSADLFRGLIEAKSLTQLINGGGSFSADLFRGLIEAVRPALPVPKWRPFSADLFRGLIEASNTWRCKQRSQKLFRGFIPRPH